MVLFQPAGKGEEIYRIGLVELGKKRSTSLRYTLFILISCKNNILGIHLCRDVFQLFMDQTRIRCGGRAGDLWRKGTA